MGCKVMSNRKWISREEIAEIYDEIGNRACLSGGPIGNTDEAHENWKKASGYRAIERLSNLMGNRVA